MDYIILLSSLAGVPNKVRTAFFNKTVHQGIDFIPILIKCSTANRGSYVVLARWKNDEFVTWVAHYNDIDHPKHPQFSFDWGHYHCTDDKYESALNDFLKRK